MHRYWDFGFGPVHGFGWIFMAFFWIAVIVFLVYLLRMVLGGRDAKTKRKSALDLLNERYAKGEIDKQTYDQRKLDILN